MMNRVPSFDRRKPTVELPQGVRMLLHLTQQASTPTHPGRWGVKHVYAGTVPWKVKARRRAANKRARVARRAARR